MSNIELYIVLKNNSKCLYYVLVSVIDKNNDNFWLPLILREMVDIAKLDIYLIILTWQGLELCQSYLPERKVFVARKRYSTFPDFRLDLADSVKTDL